MRSPELPGSLAGTVSGWSMQGRVRYLPVRLLHRMQPGSPSASSALRVALWLIWRFSKSISDSSNSGRSCRAFAIRSCTGFAAEAPHGVHAVGGITGMASRWDRQGSGKRVLDQRFLQLKIRFRYREVLRALRNLRFGAHHVHGRHGFELQLLRVLSSVWLAKSSDC